jgi:hypothetical protein
MWGIKQPKFKKSSIGINPNTQDDKPDFPTRESKLPSFERRIPMPKCEPPRKKDKHTEPILTLREALDINPEMVPKGENFFKSKFTEDEYIFNKEIGRFIKVDFPPNVKREILKEKESNIDLLKELLDNPRVEGITISIDKVGEVEKINIDAKLKENPAFLVCDDSKISEEEKQELFKHFNSKSKIEFDENCLE